MTCSNQERVYEFVAGSIDQQSRSSLIDHLGDCSDCNDLLRSLEQLTGDLTIDPEALKDDHLDEAVLTLVRLDRVPPVRKAPRSNRPLLIGLASGISVAAAVFLIFWLSPIFFQAGDPEHDEGVFIARGAGAGNLNRWVSIKPYRAEGNGYQPIRGKLVDSDKLAFSYVNRADPPFEQLVVFALEESGQIHWYFPGEESRREETVGVPIKSSVKPVPLPEEVNAGLREGRAKLFAIFSYQPLAQSAIGDAASRALKEAGGLDRIKRLDINGTGQHNILITVSTAAQGAEPK